MLLNLKHLKEFASAQANVKTYSILPILNYIRFKDGVITKSDAKQYISMRSDFTGEALIDSHVLISYISRAKADIRVTQKGNKLTLTDGFTTVSSPTDNITDYPHPDIPSGEGIELSEDICDMIGSCAAPLLDDEIQVPHVLHVFTGNGLIAGANNFWGVSFKVQAELPVLALRKMEAVIIGGLSGCQFHESGSWHFMTSGAFTYGVIKSESKWYDLSPYFTAAEPDFSLNKSDIYGFCDTVIATCPGKDLLTSLQAQGGMLTLAAKDTAYDIDVAQNIPCETDIPRFGFDPRNLLKLFKAMPADQYGFAKGRSMYHLVDGNRTGLIIEMLLKNM